MKVKRFLAPDIRQAMQMVREQQGPDAVILSNRKVDGGIEIITALEFDAELLSQTMSESSETVRVAGTNPTTEEIPQTVKTKSKPNIKQSGVSGLGSIVDRFLGEQKEFDDSAQRRGVELPASSTKLANEKIGIPEKNLEISGLHQEIRDIRRQLDYVVSENTNTQYSSKHPTHIGVLRYLSNYGFHKRLCFDLANQFGTDYDYSSAKQKAKDALAAKITVSGDDLIDAQGVVALVGPTGVGKTTTIAKLASKICLKNGQNQVALVSIDNYRIGAHEQLNTYGRILGIPVRTASSPKELKQIVKGFRNKRLVLIDTAGMGQHDDRLARQRSFLHDLNMPIKMYLLMSAASQMRVLKEVFDAFRGFQPKACILTKLDETAFLGPALSLIIEQGLPLSFVTDGQTVPDDIYQANRSSIVERCFEKDLSSHDEPLTDPGQFQFQKSVAQDFL